ncbi:aspartate/ornithine carbamoyltransferase, Asp/Orn binding domain family [Candidatus Moduliflexus flocculans]|uniref:Aspartate/ornithine carbamoyltransferase, Asp/Orn binding domain family n=1 Tax=Candidatus Moduliflexus flocculans TaxID=1499966 RepID=A0A0S6VWL9_9BACT|nr:aspartate/ornithine carbamoyltransferase, Asp/Orn binding domain family [Candidatus Moduliflexus flocculans]
MASHPLLSAISEFSASRNAMYGKDMLLTWEKSDDELRAILAAAALLREMYAQNISTRVFDSGLAVSNFRDNSTRTRFSFASATNLLGLTVQDLDEGKSQIAHGETVRETAIMMSFLTQVIGIRDDIYLGAGNAYMRQVAAAVDEGFREGTLMQRPTIVNLQCDIDHPTQTMADLAYLKQYFGGLDQLKGKKIAMTWAYSPSYGKPLSVPQGVIGLMTRFGMNVALAYPEGYNLIPETLDIARQNATRSGGSFEIANSMEAAFADADIVYPKSWAPYSVMEERTQLLSAKDYDSLKALEQRCLQNNAKFTNWECTEALMSRTKGGNALYMHCLPADITDVSCKQGEVSKSVFEKARIDTYKEASWKPFVIAAMIFLSKFEQPGSVLEELVKRSPKRVL